MRVIFLGTPAFAVPVLDAIISAGHEVAAVVTQPDRVNARGNKVSFSPVKTAALAANLPVLQFEKISREGCETLAAFHADIMVTAAYGQILSQKILDLCPKGVINAHASVLPKYRGSSPVQWAIVNGDETLGVSVMQTAKRVDSGDVILIKTLKLSGSENSEEALQKLSKIAGEGIAEALLQIETGTAVFTPQNENEATHCRMIEKEDGKLDFAKDAQAAVNFIRGMNPWPSAFCTTPHGRLKILRAETDETDYPACAPGTVVRVDKKGVSIACGKGAIRLLEVQGEGGKAMDAGAYFRGRPVALATVFQ